jgi:hypothetical protein
VLDRWWGGGGGRGGRGDEAELASPATGSGSRWLGRQRRRGYKGGGRTT